MIPIAFLTAPSRLPINRSTALPQTCSRRASIRTLAPRMGMSVKSQSLPNSQLRLEISVGSEECTAAWDAVLKDLMVKSNIKGFRKGKAPKQVVISQYGKQNILASACEEVIEKSINKAIQDAGISAIGQAQVDEEGGVNAIIKEFSPQSDLTFNVKIDVWPEATFTEPYETLQIEAEEAILDEALVDKALEDLRKKESFSILSPEGTTAALGQLVVADLAGYYRKEDNTKGEKLPDIADGDSVDIKMNEGQYMAGFVEGLIGASVGETRDVNVEFPERNPRPELAGLKAIFEITVHAIKDVILPELTDEFAMQVSEETTMADLRNTVRNRLDTEAEGAQEKNINNAIDTKLASIIEVTIPDTLTENQVKNKFANMLASFKDKGMADEQVKAMVSKENYELYKTRALPNVEKTLRINFAVSKIAKDNALIVDQGDIEGQMALVKAELKGQEYEEDKLRDQVEGQLERDMVLKLLKQTAKINIVPKKEALEAVAKEAKKEELEAVAEEAKKEELEAVAEEAESS